MTDADVARSRDGQGITEIYLEIVDKGKPELVRIMESASRLTGPMLLHCAAGKDRTGIAVAMLLSAAGVVDDDVADDYRKTNGHLGAVVARLRLGSELHENVPMNPAQTKIGAVPEAIRAVLDVWGSYPGGIRSWLLDHGAEAEWIDRWTHRFTSAVS